MCGKAAYVRRSYLRLIGNITTATHNKGAKVWIGLWVRKQPGALRAKNHNRIKLRCRSMPIMIFAPGAPGCACCARCNVAFLASSGAYIAAFTTRLRCFVPPRRPSVRPPASVLLSSLCPLRVHAVGRNMLCSFRFLLFFFALVVCKSLGAYILAQNITQ